MIPTFAARNLSSASLGSTNHRCLFTSASIAAPRASRQSSSTATANEVVYESSLNFDQELPQYGTTHGVLPRAQPDVAMSSPVMWADALDVMFGRMAKSGVEVGRIAAICGSAQQHGSVYLNRRAAAGIGTLDPSKPLAGQVAPMLSRQESPIWMDSSTSAECREITDAVGGAGPLSQHTGSRAFERFTGPQIRKFFKTEPAAYERNRPRSPGELVHGVAARRR